MEQLGGWTLELVLPLSFCGTLEQSLPFLGAPSPSRMMGGAYVDQVGAGPLPRWGHEEPSL